jgi:hypothetical protein
LVGDFGGREGEKSERGGMEKDFLILTVICCMNRRCGVSNHSVIYMTWGASSHVVTIAELDNTA